MIIRSEDWERIRAQFSEPEKAQLRKAVTGETICPRGWCVEDERIPVPLFNKLYAALKERK